jgi:hypothetical protein
MENEYKKYIEMMKKIYLESHDNLNDFDEWFDTTQKLCDILCQ